MSANFLETHLSEPPLRGSFWSGQRLPDDLLAAASRRLGYLSVIIIVVHVLAWIAWFSTAPEVLAPPGRFPMGHVAAGVSIAGSALLFVAIRLRWIGPVRLLDVALAWEVFVALGISLEEFTDPLLMERVPTGISWTCWWISIFPLLIPNTWGKSFVAALLSAASGPLAVLMLVSVNDNPMPTGEHFLILFFPNFIAAGWAAAASKIVHALGAEVGRAREMGSYHLTQRLGAGGMGEVWKASHRMLARPAAVKLIRLGKPGDRRKRAEALGPRFEREAQATAALQSPHTIGLYDFGVSKRGDFYYVMELLDGLDLDTLVAEDGPQSPERVVHIIRQVCESLREAHQCGLIHRDIKPANLFLCRYGADVDFVKVLDFGLVKDAVAADDDVKMTKEGTAVGTPAFMAPEMALKNEHVDARADIYAVGCVMYWLLTGTLVFGAKTRVEMAIKHAHDEPEAPSKVTELEIPHALEDIVMECLKKDPDERPQSARELSDRLAQLSFDDAWTEERMTLWWDTHHPPKS